MFTGGCTSLSKSTLVKMPHFWKSHVAAHTCFTPIPNNAHREIRLLNCKYEKKTVRPMQEVFKGGVSSESVLFNSTARMLKNLYALKGDYWVKQQISSLASLFKLEISHKGLNLLPEGANFFL